MNTLAPAFLIGSSSFLQVTRTYMNAWTSSNFNRIPPPTPELSALARLKNCCEHSSAYIFDWIFFIFSSPEPLGSQGELIEYPWIRRPSVRPSASVVRPHFQTSSPLKPLGQSKPNFIWCLLGKGERKIV